MEENTNDDLYNIAMETNNKFVIDYVNEKFKDEDREDRALRIILWQDKTKEDIEKIERNKNMDKICFINQEKKEIFTSIMNRINLLFSQNQAEGDYNISFSPLMSNLWNFSDLLIHIEFCELSLSPIDIFSLSEICNITGTISFVLNYEEDKVALNIILRDYFFDITEYEK